MDNKTVGGRRVALISDDDEFFRMALSSVLTARLGFSEVIATQTFDGAAEKLSNRDDVEIALFDLNMPGMNNWQNLRTLRECFPGVRAAVVSGSQDRNDILMALRVGLHGYVSKGLGVSELSRALQIICEGTVYLPSFFPDLPIGGDELPRPPDNEPSNRPDTGVLADLTKRQREVLEMLINGKSNKAMARILDVSEGTIKFHVSAVFRVLRASNRVEAATCGARLLDHARM